MPKVLFHGSIQGFRGKIGNLIFRQLPDGSTVVSEAPPEKTARQKKKDKLKRSAAQKAHNNHFKEGVAYAKAAQVQPVYRELAAAAPVMTAYNFALRDYLCPPVIHCVERAGGVVRVQASDEVGVSAVRVSVLDEQGAVLETGDAVRVDGEWWEYASQAVGASVHVEAGDLAGNVTRETLKVFSAIQGFN